MLIKRHLLPRKWTNYTHCMNVTYPLSIATPNALLNGPVCKVPLQKRWRYVQVQQHKHPLTKTDQATAVTDCLIYQQQITKLSHQYDTIFQGEQPAIWLQVDYIGFLQPWIGHQLVFTIINMCSRYMFTCSTYNASAILLNNCLWIKRMAYALSWYSTQLCFWPRKHFKAKNKTKQNKQEKHSNGLLPMKLTGLTVLSSRRSWPNKKSVAPYQSLIFNTNWKRGSTLQDDEYAQTQNKQQQKTPNNFSQ